MRLVQDSLAAAAIIDGPLFRAAAQGGAIGGGFDRGEVARISRQVVIHLTGTFVLALTARS